LAFFRALDRFFLDLLAFLEVLRLGEVMESLRSANEAPSLSRSDVISRINAMYSSGVNIMSLAIGYQPIQAESNSDCTKAAYTDASARARTPNTRQVAERANELLVPSTFTKKSLVLIIARYGS